MRKKKKKIQISPPPSLYTGNNFKFVSWLFFRPYIYIYVCIFFFYFLTFWFSFLSLAISETFATPVIIMFTEQVVKRSESRHMQIANLIIFADSASILFLVDRQNPKKRGRKRSRGGEGRGGEEIFFTCGFKYIRILIVRYYLFCECTNEISRWCYTQGVPKSFSKNFVYFFKNNIISFRLFPDGARIYKKNRIKKFREIEITFFFLFFLFDLKSFWSIEQHTARFYI